MRAADSFRTLDTVFEKATNDGIWHEDIAPLSVDSRCQLIGRIVEHLKTERQHTISNLISASLRQLTKSFPVSDAFHDWSETRRKRFFVELVKPANRDILYVARDWKHARMGERKAALIKSAQLQQSVYVNGIAEAIPFPHLFMENPFYRDGKKLSITFGGFRGDIAQGTGMIIQYTNRRTGFDDAQEAFDTDQHEATHGIQFILGLACHRNQIQRAHPLFEEARYFEALSVRHADVPVLFFEPYAAQTHEFLANWEAREISRGIMELAYA